MVETEIAQQEQSFIPAYPIQETNRTTRVLPETKSLLEPILQRRQEKLTGMLHNLEQFLMNEAGERQDLFPIDWVPTENAPTLEEQGASNLIYTRLMDTLTGVAIGATQQAVSPEQAEQRRQNYEKIAEAVEPLVHTWSAFAKEQLPLVIDQDAERNHRRKDDPVYIYQTSAIDLNETQYDDISIFIRPEDYKNGDETRQARMVLTATPKDKLACGVSMRLDYDNNIHAQELVFDLEVISNGVNLLDITRLPASSVGKVQHQHHFKSGITENELGVPYAQVLRSMVAKAEANRLPVQ